MDTASTAESGTSGPAGTRIVAAGTAWDAVRVGRFLGLEALERLGSAAGPVLVDPAARTMYFLVPAGSTTDWDVPQSQALGETNHVVIPPATRQSPPGPYWLIDSRHPLTSTPQLRQALQAALGPRTAAQLNLDCLTLDQIRGWNCALCNARLHADRPLGTFSTGHGILTEPTELWACAPTCKAAAGAAH
ncbi:hypothetical protein P8A21_39835 (plasmid) [Streptomyces poriferorum]|uniref:hypothetical protein n=1 Tax=Streptomyces poriferorum TaxID=2798799 RepID=UPI00273D0EE2|nr:hypothetical protein [Streptomyces sp. Alt1]WLQ53702.1 hypothetical protein P8A21_39835 [Streptomyces sp. Alt1]